MEDLDNFLVGVIRMFPTHAINGKRSEVRPRRRRDGIIDIELAQDRAELLY